MLVSDSARSCTPERSLSQRRAALARANEIRSRRAEVKRELKQGRASVTDLVAEPPAVLDTMKVFDLLLAVPKVGRVKAGAILKRHRISPSKSVGGLSVRQRRELVLALVAYRPSVRSVRRMEA